ncbi:MAG: 30S ribosomal protein S20 [Alphaproteobacteria bacterium]|nr:30S ribosomal protein S20 [Alphaproteobacteria bacterium]MDD9920618.1 30S ribosomal protein S20 [Alphaproteobacteria bacterium]
MAHTIQARKRIRQDSARNEANAMMRSRVRTFVKNLETAIEAGAKDQITTAFKAAMSELHKAARKGVLSSGAVNRKVSRLAASIKRAS